MSTNKKRLLLNQYKIDRGIKKLFGNIFFRDNLGECEKYLIELNTLLETTKELIRESKLDICKKKGKHDYVASSYNYFSGAYTDGEKYHNTCNICQRNKWFNKKVHFNKTLKNVI